MEAEILPAPPDEVADEDASDDEGLDDETIDVEARSKGDDDDAQGDAVDDVLAEVEVSDDDLEAIAREHPRHDYADNALYWKGEAAYDQRNFSGALAAFTAVVERYGGGNKAPDALLKIGLCYHNLGDAANARDVLTELIAAYPGARASDIARVKLAELGS